MARLRSLSTFAGLTVFGLRCLALSGWSARALAAPFDTAGTWSLPVSTAGALLPAGVAGVAGFLIAAGAVAGCGWAARRLIILAGGGPNLVFAAGLVPGLLLPAGGPLGALAPVLLAAFALAGLAGAVAAHLERGGALVLLELMLWSDLLALASPDWIWVAIALCVALAPLLGGRGRGRVEAPLAVIAAGGAWAVILRALVESGLGLTDRPPVSDGGAWMVGLLGLAATIVLVGALSLLATGRAEYGLTVALGVTGIAALVDVAVPGISAPAGLAAVVAMPALALVAWRALVRPVSPAAGAESRS